MALHIVPSFRPVLFGSMLLMMSAACRRAERSDVVDDTTGPQDTPSSQSAPAAPAEYPSSMERERQEQERIERIHVTGKDVDPALLERERAEQERRERIHVTGRDGVESIGVDEDLQGDEDLQPGGAMAGSAGSGGSAGSN
jgi:hypothetical protein